MKIHKFHTHGDGTYRHEDFKACGSNVVIENGVLIFHPENISIGNNVYVGHQTILKGYYKNEMSIYNDVWIGQQCFFHSGGGIVIKDGAGIGPKVSIISSMHDGSGRTCPVMSSDIIFKSVIIGIGCDIGCGAIILPGVEIGEGSIIGAGSVVTKNVPPYEVWAGIPAKQISKRS